jgi:hypothetical protein
MMLIPVANEEDAAALRERPLVAVDMGFSGKSKSCGVALAASDEKSITKPYHFGTAVRTAAEFLRDHRSGVLILEAPLSGAFDAKRNPRARSGFEDREKPRWWSFGAGAQMALAALYFCRQLDEGLPGNVAVHLIEGFVVGDESGAHADVADRLARAFRGQCRAEWHTVSRGGDTVSIADWFGKRGQLCPVILQPRDI